MSEVRGAAVGWEWRRMGGRVGRRGGLGGAEGVEAGAVAVMGRKDGSGCSAGRGGNGGGTEGGERGRGRGGREATHFHDDADAICSMGILNSGSRALALRFLFRFSVGYP